MYRLKSRSVVKCCKQMLQLMKKYNQLLPTVLAFMLATLPVAGQIRLGAVDVIERPDSQPQVADCDCVPDEVIVQVSKPSVLSEIAAQYGLSSRPLASLGSPPVYLLRITSWAAPQDLVAQLRTDRRVRMAEVNKRVKTVDQADWT